MMISIYETQQFLIEQDTQIFMHLRYNTEVLSEGVLSGIGKVIKTIIERMVDLIRKFIKFITGNKNKENKLQVYKNEDDYKLKQEYEKSKNILNQYKNNLKNSEIELKEYKVFSINIRDDFYKYIKSLNNPSMITAGFDDILEILDKVLNISDENALTLNYANNDFVKTVDTLFDKGFKQLYEDKQECENDPKKYIIKYKNKFGIPESIIMSMNKPDNGVYFIDDITSTIVSSDNKLIGKMDEFVKNIDKYKNFVDDAKDIEKLEKPLKDFENRLSKHRTKLTANSFLAGNNLYNKQLSQTAYFAYNILNTAIVCKLSLIYNSRKVVSSYIQNKQTLSTINENIKYYKEEIEKENKHMKDVESKMNKK